VWWKAHINQFRHVEIKLCIMPLQAGMRTKRRKNKINRRVTRPELWDHLMPVIGLRGILLEKAKYASFLLLLFLRRSLLRRRFPVWRRSAIGAPIT
jgi:hypothetical protein